MPAGPLPSVRSFHFFRISLLLLAFVAILPSFHAQNRPIEFRQGGKWGVIGKGGKVIVPALYDRISFTERGMIIAGKGGRYGLLDSLGNMLLPCEYDHLIPNRPNYLSLRQGGLYGKYCFDTGVKIPCRFTSLGRFINGIAATTVGGSCPGPNCGKELKGLIDLDGNELIAPRYKELRPLQFGFYEARNDSSLGLVKLGTDLYIPTGLSQIEILSPNRLLIARNGECSMIDTLQNKVASRIYNSLKGAPNGLIYFEDGLECGLLDTLGKEKMRGDWDELRMASSDWVFCLKNKRWGVLNSQGQEQIVPRFETVDLLGSNKLTVSVAGRSGVFRTTGETILPIIFSEIKPIRAGQAYIVRQGEGLSLMDDLGRKTSVKNVQGISNKPVGNVLLFERHGKKGITNLRGEILAPAEYDHIKLQPEFARASKGKESKMYYFTSKGKATRAKRFMMVKTKAQSEAPQRMASAPQTGIAWFYSRQNGRFGLRDYDRDTVLIPPIYHRVYRPWGMNYTMVARKNKHGQVRYGLVDHQNVRIILRPMLASLEVDDFLGSKVARATLPNGDRALVGLNGRVLRSRRLAYVDAFRDSVARANVDGRMKWKSQRSGEMLESRTRKGHSQQEFLHVEGGRWGFIDSNGHWVLKPKYEFVSKFIGGVAFYKRKGKWGMLNASFEEITPAEYVDMLHLQQKVGMWVRTTVYNGQYGYMDRTGKMQVKAQYLKARNFQDGLAAVKTDQGWGYIDRNGSWQITPRYAKAGDFSEGRALITQAGSRQLIDRSGNTIAEFVGSKLRSFHGGRAAAQKRGRWGYLDTSGSWAIAPVYLSAADFIHGLAVVRSRRGYGLLAPNGKMVLPPRQYRIGEFVEGMAVFGMPGKQGMVDTTGTVIIPPRYRRLEPFSEGLALARDRAGFHYLNREGAVVLSHQHRDAGSFGSGLAPALKGDRWGYIDREGHWAILPRWPIAKEFEGGFAQVHSAKGWAFIDPEGVMLPGNFVKTTSFRNGHAAVRHNQERVGLINQYGTKIGYERATIKQLGGFEEGVAAVCNDKTWRLVNTCGEQVSKQKFMEKPVFSEGLAAVKIGFQYGVLRKDGSTLLPAENDLIDGVLGLMRVHKGNAAGILSFDENWKVPLSAKSEVP